MDVNTRSRMLYDANRKDVVVAYLLWFFLSYFGAHRFYLGRYGSGAAQLGLAVGGLILLVVFVGLFLWAALGIWVLVDAVLIPGMVREHNLSLIDRI
jgi:TM2 domain-containing membrane protein YozV